jgi:hypothetical protein
MAYPTYTPTATKFVDVDLPDDSALQDDGIGAVDTPMETIADGLLWCTESADITYDVAGTTTASVFFCNSAVSTDWQDTPIAISVAANVGDRILLTFTFGLDPNGATNIGIDVFSSDTGAEIPGTFQFISAAKEWGPVTLTCVVQALSTATLTFTVRGRCTAGNFDFTGGATQNAIRIARL